MNVTGVEPLMSPREKMSVDAIYLLTPTAQNVERIIADFASGRDTYKSAHLYFVDGEWLLLKYRADNAAIDDKLAQRLTDTLPRDKLRAFVELNCNFWGRSCDMRNVLTGSDGGPSVLDAVAAGVFQHVRCAWRTGHGGLCDGGVPRRHDGREPNGEYGRETRTTIDPTDRR